MGGSVTGPREPIVGRVRERALLAGAVERASRGSACTVLVHGEAGVGKTSLVADSCERARARGFDLLWGRCLRFGATASPYLPFVGAFEAWLSQADAAERAALLASAPGIAGLVPSLGGAARTDAGRLLADVDRAVGALAARRPLVLVVDDLHWADVTSRDVLTYLVAGRSSQRLLVVGTYRDSELPDGDPLHGWLADVRRMPGVRELALDRLTPEETREQIAMLLGAEPAPELVQDVLDRSAGNPYFTELLVRGLDPSTQRLDGELPDALRSALLASWHRLSAPARALARVLAVAGRPVSPTVLMRASTAAGTGPDTVDDALHEASEAGVVRVDRGGKLWFRHPLLAEVLSSTLRPDEARRLHACLVEEFVADGSIDTRHLADLALHYEGAGLVDEAFEHCLLAAKEAAAVHAYPEEADLRLRADRLRPQVSSVVRAEHPSREVLLAMTASAQRRAGDMAGAFRSIDAARRHADPAREPLTAAEILVRWSQMAFMSGHYTLPPLAALREAVVLSEPWPGSSVHTQALAELAEAELAHGHRDAALEHAGLAVQAGRRSRDPAALSVALGARSAARLGRPGSAEDAEESYRVAVRSGRAELVALACVTRCNALDAQGRLAECAEAYREASMTGLSLGVAGATQLTGAYGAQYLAVLGRLEEARSLLRHVLATRPTAVPAMQVRLSCLMVATREGRLDEAAGHLLRVRELSESFWDVVGSHASGILSEYLVATGRPLEALDVLRRTIVTHTRAEHRYGDLLLVHAAEAAAEAAEQARDARDPAAVRAAQRALTEIESLRTSSATPLFEGDDPVQRAVRTLYAAHRARCLDAGDATDRWREAVVTTREAGLCYELARALLRLAEQLLVTAEHRAEAARSVREAHQLATEMGARLLGWQAEALAQASRISLESPQLPEQRDGRLDLLTRREQEVLAHLVAGRTYTEIAGALFISEKTVSVHVSNLLRKTGTRSRAEASAWARRNGLTTTT